jgi:hypothetical protein
MSAAIHPYSYHQYGDRTRSAHSLTICTQIKEETSSVLSYHDLFDKLNLADYVQSISSLPEQRKCPPAPRHGSVAAFCWSHVVGH